MNTVILIKREKNATMLLSPNGETIASADRSGIVISNEIMAYQAMVSGITYWELREAERLADGSK